MIADDSFNSLEWQALKVGQLKQLQGATIEDLETVSAGYVDESGEPVPCGVLLYVKDQNEQRQVIDISAIDTEYTPGEVAFSRAEYQKEE